MDHKIIVCGGNGAGKSTLGRALAERLGYSFLDIESYYFPHRQTAYPYDKARTDEEAGALLLADMKALDHFVLAAVKGARTAMVRASGMTLRTSSKEIWGR